MTNYAQLFRDFFRANLNVFQPQRRETMRWKADRSMVGPGDDEMHRMLGELLRKEFSSPVISEEGGYYTWPPTHRRFWIIDPRDGSNNAGRGLYPLTGSMASLVEDGEPVFSCIFVPAEERDCCNGFYFAIRDGGAWRCDVDGSTLLEVSKTDKMERAALLIEGPSREIASDERISRLQRMMAWRINLTCAWSFTRLASGVADVLIAAHNKPTDTLHGILFAQESGGLVTDFCGNPPTLANCQNLLYSNGALHQSSLNILRA